ncbi:hypothetical protein [Methylobacterium sp. Leaf94]|uniref:hypothetical protein n=1 Tax=Methylobacterium sp. Leaf94 TaxID=1736250 RepID=UPI000A56BA80|nr:hypothetical protein [Methylobacterium sp. Leaf94]
MVEAIIPRVSFLTYLANPPYGDFDAVLGTVVEALTPGPYLLGDRHSAADGGDRPATETRRCGTPMERPYPIPVPSPGRSDPSAGQDGLGRPQS